MVNPIVEFIKNLSSKGLEYIGLYYSVYEGYVIDNEDPDNRNRLQLMVPQVWGNFPNQDWVLPKGMYVGKTHSLKITPQKGDVVYVSFQHGRADKPMWEFGYPAKGELPTTYSSPNQISLVTPKGNKLIIDESSDSPTITIEHSSGKKVVVTEDMLQLWDKVTVMEDQLKAFNSLLVKDGEARIGSDTSPEPILLGNATKDCLQQITEVLGTCVNAALVPASSDPRYPLILTSLNTLKSTTAKVGK